MVAAARPDLSLDDWQDKAALWAAATEYPSDDDTKQTLPTTIASLNAPAVSLDRLELDAVDYASAYVDAGDLSGQGASMEVHQRHGNGGVGDRA